MKIVSIAANEASLYALADNGDIWIFRLGKWEKVELPPLE
jgi:hypothetical protein